MVTVILLGLNFISYDQPYMTLIFLLGELNLRSVPGCSPLSRRFFLHYNIPFRSLTGPEHGV